MKQIDTYLSEWGSIHDKRKYSRWAKDKVIYDEQSLVTNIWVSLLIFTTSESEDLHEKGSMNIWASLWIFTMSEKIHER